MAEFLTTRPSPERSRRQSEILDLLTRVVVMHQVYRPCDWALWEGESEEFVHRASSNPEYARVNRGLNELDIFHVFDLSSLQQFVNGGCLLDLGAGSSGLLGCFEDTCRKLAIEINPVIKDFHSMRGHEVHEDTSSIEDGSVRLLHASYSLPFWSTSLDEATRSAQEIVRLLEPGGMAFISPIARENGEKWHYLARQNRPITTNPWTDGDKADGSHIDSAFIKGLLEFCDGRITIDGLAYAKGSPADKGMPNLMVVYKH